MLIFPIVCDVAVWVREESSSIAYPPLEYILITNTDVGYVVIGFASKLDILNPIWVSDMIWLFRNDDTDSWFPEIVHVGVELTKVGRFELLIVHDGLEPMICISVGNIISKVESDNMDVDVVIEISIVRGSDTPEISTDSEGERV